VKNGGMVEVSTG